MSRLGEFIRPDKLPTVGTNWSSFHTKGNEQNRQQEYNSNSFHFELMGLYHIQLLDNSPDIIKKHYNNGKVGSAGPFGQKPLVTRIGPETANVLSLITLTAKPRSSTDGSFHASHSTKQNFDRRLKLLVAIEELLKRQGEQLLELNNSNAKKNQKVSPSPRRNVSYK